MNRLKRVLGSACHPLRCSDVPAGNAVASGPSPMPGFDQPARHSPPRRLGTGDLAMCLAAFLFIIGALVFVHPPSPATRTAALKGAAARAAAPAHPGPAGGR